MVVGKLANGSLVQILKVADRVKFSDDRGWVCICKDFQQPLSKQQSILWLPSTTRFEWVRDFKLADVV